MLLKLAHDNKTAYESQFEGCELEVLVEEVVKKNNKTYLRDIRRDTWIYS